MKMDNVSWAEAVESCVHCREMDFGAGFGPRTLLICSCCQSKGTHVECEEQHAGVSFTKEHIDNTAWFCSEVRGSQASLATINEGAL